MLAPYVEEGIVTIRDWPVLDGRVGQIPAYNDCLRWHRHDSRWIAFLDLDEFLFSPSGESLPSVLADYEQWPAVAVRWAMFGTSGHKTRPPGLVIENYQRRIDFDGGINMKTIADPTRVTTCLSAHHFGYPYLSAVDENHFPMHDTPEALKASVGADRVVLGTADDDAALAALRDRFGIDAAIAEGAVTFHVEAGEAFVPRLFAELGVGITSVTVSRPTLDDVFMRYTGSTIRDAEASPDRRPQPRDGACRLEGRPMSAAIADIVAVRVPERSWRSEVRAVRVVWWRDLIRLADDPGADPDVADPAAAVPVRPRARAAVAVGGVHRRRGPHHVHVPRGPLHGDGVQRDDQRGVAGDGPRARVPAGDDGRAGPPVVDHRSASAWAARRSRRARG